MIIESAQYHQYFHLKKLLQIHNYPARLYVEGNLELLNKEDYKILCVIGSRKSTSYGRDAVEYLLRDIQKEKIIILSGLALGIDGIAHKEAIKNDLYTISIPGSGLDRHVIHPQTHSRLADQIIEKDGLLISERAPDFKATIWSFPSRNRIEAAIADAVLIIESEEKSGTQITARLALEYNRNIGVIPGSIFSPMSVGTIKLWREGAMPVCDANDLRELLNIKESPTLTDLISQTYDNLDTIEKQIMAELIEPIDKERLIASLGIEYTEALIAIIQLEAKGYIKEEWGEMRRVR